MQHIIILFCFLGTTGLTMSEVIAISIIVLLSTMAILCYAVTPVIVVPIVKKVKQKTKTK